MRPKTKSFNYLSALVLVFSLFCMMGWGRAIAAEEKFPNRPLELIVPTAPGGGTDVAARFLADIAGPILGQKVIVINKPGASATIGLTAIAQAKPDGYTLGSVWNGPLTMVPQVLKVSYTVADFSYLTLTSKIGVVFCVRAEFPASTAAEFFAYARKNPAKLTYSNDGVGNATHFAAERLFQAMKVKLRPVPYGGGGEAIKALLGGHVDVYGGTVISALPHIQAGTIRALFVTTRGGADSLPGVPGVSDLGYPEAETASWRGIIGPKGIPPSRFTMLQAAFREAAQSQKVKEHMKGLGEAVVTSTEKEFEELARTEFATMAVTAKELGLVPK
jgi:tripartite-type tricarboxylate transporter receptor subunit TctC